MPFQTVLIQQALPRHLRAVLRLESACFPDGWNADGDDGCFFRNALRDPCNLNVFLMAGCRRVGYALAVPMTAAAAYLAPYDPDLQPRPEYYYLETIQVHPRYRGRGGAQMLMQRTIEEAAKKGGRGMAVHLRVSNGANRLPRRIPGIRVIAARQLAAWYWGGNEPYEYLEIVKVAAKCTV